MSKVKVNPAYVSKCIDEIKCSSLSDAKRETIVKILTEYLELKEIDLDTPQHFTREQSKWIKAYCIKRNREFYNQALEDITDGIFKILPDNIETRISSGAFAIELLNIVENLKGGEEE